MMLAYLLMSTLSWLQVEHGSTRDEQRAHTMARLDPRYIAIYKIDIRQSKTQDKHGSRRWRGPLSRVVSRVQGEA